MGIKTDWFHSHNCCVVGFGFFFPQLFAIYLFIALLLQVNCNDDGKMSFCTHLTSARDVWQLLDCGFLFYICNFLGLEIISHVPLEPTKALGSRMIRYEVYSILQMILLCRLLSSFFKKMFPCYRTLQTDWIYDAIKH